MNWKFWKKAKPEPTPETNKLVGEVSEKGNLIRITCNGLVLTVSEIRDDDNIDINIGEPK